MCVSGRAEAACDEKNRESKKGGQPAGSTRKYHSHARSSYHDKYHTQRHSPPLGLPWAERGAREEQWHEHSLARSFHHLPSRPVLVLSSSFVPSAFGSSSLVHGCCRGRFGLV